MREWLYSELALIASRKYSVKRLAKEFECTEAEVNQAIKRYQIDMKIPRYRIWTVQEREILRKMKADGATTQEIAFVLNRSTSMIHTQSCKMGISKSRAKAWSDKQEDTLIQLREAGYQFTFIGECLGKSPSACSMRYYRMTGSVK